VAVEGTRIPGTALVLAVVPAGVAVVLKQHWVGEQLVQPEGVDSEDGSVVEAPAEAVVVDIDTVPGSDTSWRCSKCSEMKSNFQSVVFSDRTATSANPGEKRSLQPIRLDHNLCSVGIVGRMFVTLQALRQGLQQDTQDPHFKVWWQKAKFQL
jgi:hypothetical protein